MKAIHRNASLGPGSVLIGLRQDRPDLPGFRGGRLQGFGHRHLDLLDATPAEAEEFAGTKGVQITEADAGRAELRRQCRPGRRILLAADESEVLAAEHTAVKGA